ncbi:YcnI family protein [Actinokineospora sp. PR83]|uniref:YcnI family copper-binding membrane protein n=1 Tax=Actinokineospora sp. PR83 TaxID=2884908 RepID=UPI0027DFDB6F|nr:DUF1775 domain-containing protein [Actinokineospora sp. PR83]MCG8920774.1 YcnI family protein [Actinokineospora sp. PR83]
MPTLAVLPSRGAARAGVLAAATALFAVALAGPASAHVTVSPTAVSKKGVSRLTFQVPNESPTAGTVSVRLTLPLDTPVTFAMPAAKPGWTAAIGEKDLDKPLNVGGYEVTKTVHTVTWTAAPGTRLEPSTFTLFEVLLGELPQNTDRILLPITQTYDDGKVVDWADPPLPDGGEPNSPAPVLTLTDGGAEHDAHAAPAAAQQTAAETPWLAVSALVVGALALGLSIGNLLARRRKTG